MLESTSFLTPFLPPVSAHPNPVRSQSRQSASTGGFGGPRVGSRLRPDYALAALLVDAGANCKVAHAVADGALEVSVFQMLALRYALLYSVLSPQSHLTRTFTVLFAHPRP